MNATDIAARLKDKGQPMTLKRRTGGTYDPVTGGMTSPTYTQWAVNGIVANFNSGARTASANSPNTMILGGDRQAIIDATQTPLPGDTLTIGGVDWSVIDLDTIDPAGVPLLHKCHVRK